MKKFLALFLVLVMAFSCILVSCKKNEEEEPEDTEDDGFIGLGTYATTTGTGDGDPVETGNTHTDFTWKEVNETVYVAVDRLSVRSDTRVAEDTWVATVNFGEKYTRVRYNSQWSEIEYNGEKRFVATQYVTTSDGSVVFNDMEDKTMYVSAEKSLNLRRWTDASSDADNIGVQLKRGAQVTLNGMSKNGTWARVKYNGVDYYCNAKYLSETEPGEATNATTTPITPQG
ncbi:MAG: hypothetical protein IJV72_00595 [Clostridia bacterium]|nr:hypothetical protein [Clostridia bacterium]